MKKFKIILSDYDGTLASSDRRISKENIDSINSFIEHGNVEELIDRYAFSEKQIWDDICASIL